MAIGSMSDPKDGLLTDTNSGIPLGKMAIDRANRLEDVFDVQLKPFARGKFASVKHCTHRTTGEPFAAKCIKKRRRCQDVTHEILHEARVLLICSPCDRIVSMHSVFELSHEYVLVLELVAGGELQRILDEDDFMPEMTTKRVMSQVLEGVSFLHHHQIAHLDLKPQNILLTTPPPFCDIKICDFGISRLITDGSDLREIIGTPDYVAPEILNFENISLATDMWSVGCLTYVLLSGCSPFGGEDKQETFCNITTCTLEFPPHEFGIVSDAAIHFMSSLIVKDPKKRMTSIQAQLHQWIQTSSTVDNNTTTSTTTVTTDNNTMASPASIPSPSDCITQANNNNNNDNDNNGNVNGNGLVECDGAIDGTTTSQSEPASAVSTEDEDDILSSTSSASSSSSSTDSSSSPHTLLSIQKETPL